MNTRQKICLPVALLVIAITAPLSAKDATATAAKKQPLALIVMDPLARELSCACVRGHAQRDYHQLALHLGKSIGQRVNLDILNTKAEIVGVVGHVKQFGLAGDSTSPIQSQCYFSVYQIPDKFMSMAADVGIAVRTAGTPPAQVGAIRHALNQINGDLVIYRPQTMGGIISDSLAERRFSMILLGTFATLALFMSCVGIYGVISHLATQRTHEIGIRMALGAERRDVLRMVLGEGAKMTLLGVAIGLVAAFGLTRLLAAMLFGVSSHDPLTFAGVSGLLTLVALAACYIPARRAMKVDPMVALRYE